MQPLKLRTGPTSPFEAEAMELLRAIDRYQPPPGQKQRVRIRLFEQPAVRRIRILWPALVIGLVLVAAGASAAVGSRGIRQAQVSGSMAAGPQKLATVAAAPLALRSAKEQATLSPKETVTLAADTSQQLGNQESNAAASDHSSHLETPVHVAQPSEKVLVFDAMRALRREGHPERAASLLAQYLRRYPEGSLAEEALALSIEAATVLGDPRARGLADQYLARYPAGRFRSAAERARARFEP